MKYKFSYLGGPFQDYASASGYASAKRETIKGNVVIVDASSFSTHEIDDKLFKLWKETMNGDKEVRKNAKGLIVCLREDSKQDRKYFEDRQKERIRYMESMGLCEF